MVGIVEKVLCLLFKRQDIQHLGSLYLRRWLLTPSVFGWRLMLHKICRPDADRVLHDHPWDFATICLRGGYIEIVWEIGGERVEILRPWRTRFRAFSHTHRIDAILGGGVAWTLVLHGRRRHRWGFWATAKTPPMFTVAEKYFMPGYDAASAPKRWVA